MGPHISKSCGILKATPVYHKTGGQVKMKTYPFSALFSRMKYITRWSLMRSTGPNR